MVSMAKEKKKSENKDENKSSGGNIEKNSTDERRKKTIKKTFISIVVTAILYVAYFMLATVYSCTVVLFTPRPTTSLPNIPSITVRPDTSFYIGPPGSSCCIALDTSWTGFVDLPSQGRKHFRPVGGSYQAWAVNDWDKPREDDPGIEGAPWLDKNGIACPTRFKFKSNGNKVLLFISVDKI